MRKKYAGSFIVALTILTLAGCGQGENNQLSKVESVPYSNEGELFESKETKSDEAEESLDTMYVYSNAEELKDYNTVDDLLDDACALVKVKVLQADSANVRSYIYTTYNVEIIDVLYGNIDETTVNVNMPGGIITGEDAQGMISEVTEGKDAGDLSNIGNVISNGNTDRLLAVNDEAYLFLIPESETAYAVVGEYNGEVLLEEGNVFLDSNIVGFQDGIAACGLSNGSITEEEFVEAITEMLSDNN